MALDPTISLKAGQGIPEFDLKGSVGGALNIADLMQKLQYQPALLQQKLASERASQLSTETLTAGQQMLNEQTRRENATRVRLAEIARTTGNPKFNPKTGRIELDHLAIGNQAASEGMEPGVVFGYLESAAKNAQANLKTDADKNDFARSMLGSANNVLRVQTDPIRAAEIAKSSLEILTKAVGEDTAKAYANQYWKIPDTPPANPQAAGQHFIDQANINAQSTISEQQAITNKLNQAQLAVTQEQTAQAGAQGVSGPASRDPNSPQSRQVQNDYLAANPTADPLQVRKLDAAALQHMTGTGGIIAANVTPAATKAQAAANATGLATEADFYDRLAKSADKIKNKFPELTPFNILANKVNQVVLSDPDANEYYALVREAQAKGLNLATYAGRESLSQYAKGQSTQLRKQASTQGKLAASPTLTTTPGTQANPAAADSTPQSTSPINFDKSFKMKDGSVQVWKKVKEGADSDMKNWIRVK